MREHQRRLWCSHDTDWLRGDRPAASLASSTQRGGRSFCMPVKGKPMPFDTDDVGHLYELISLSLFPAAFDFALHSNAMRMHAG